MIQDKLGSFQSRVNVSNQSGSNERSSFFKPQSISSLPKLPPNQKIIEKHLSLLIKGDPLSKKLFNLNSVRFPNKYKYGVSPSIDVPSNNQIRPKSKRTSKIYDRILQTLKNAISQEEVLLRLQENTKHEADASIINHGQEVPFEENRKNNEYFSNDKLRSSPQSEIGRGKSMRFRKVYHNEKEHFHSTSPLHSSLSIREEKKPLDECMLTKGINGAIGMRTKEMNHRAIEIRDQKFVNASKGICKEMGIVNPQVIGRDLSKTERMISKPLIFLERNYNKGGQPEFKGRGSENQSTHDNSNFFSPNQTRLVNQSKAIINFRKGSNKNSSKDEQSFIRKGDQKLDQELPNLRPLQAKMKEFEKDMTSPDVNYYLYFREEERLHTEEDLDLQLYLKKKD